MTDQQSVTGNEDNLGDFIGFEDEDEDEGSITEYSDSEDSNEYSDSENDGNTTMDSEIDTNEIEDEDVYYVSSGEDDRAFENTNDIIRNGGRRGNENEGVSKIQDTRILPKCPRTVAVKITVGSELPSISALVVKEYFENILGERIEDYSFNGAEFYYLKFRNLSAVNLALGVNTFIDDSFSVVVYPYSSEGSYIWGETNKKSHSNFQPRPQKREDEQIDDNEVMRKDEVQDYEVFPCELWREIMLFVPPRYLIPNFMRVCKSFYSIFLNESFYKQLLEVYWTRINPDLLSDKTFRLIFDRRGKQSYKETFKMTMNHRYRNRLSLNLQSKFIPPELRVKKNVIFDARYFMDNVMRIRRSANILSESAYIEKKEEEYFSNSLNVHQYLHSFKYFDNFRGKKERKNMMKNEFLRKIDESYKERFNPFRQFNENGETDEKIRLHPQTKRIDYIYVKHFYIIEEGQHHLKEDEMLVRRCMGYVLLKKAPYEVVHDDDNDNKLKIRIGGPLYFKFIVDRSFRTKYEARNSAWSYFDYLPNMSKNNEKVLKLHGSVGNFSQIWNISMLHSSNKTGKRKPIVMERLTSYTKSRDRYRKNGRVVHDESVSLALLFLRGKRTLKLFRNQLSDSLRSIINACLLDRSLDPPRKDLKWVWDEEEQKVVNLEDKEIKKIV